MSSSPATCSCLGSLSASSSPWSGSSSSSNDLRKAGVRLLRDGGRRTDGLRRGDHAALAARSALRWTEGETESGNGGSLKRREILSAALMGSLLVLSPLVPEPCVARERRSRVSVPVEEYKEGENGLKYFDVEQGKGAVVEKGSTVSVHFDCIYKTLTVVSSRESKLLGGNRIIAEPYELTVGSVPGRERKRDFVENANGLYSAQAAPKPPPALYTITEGMRVGGKRTVIVPPEQGYGSKGFAEIPPGATFELNIELLEIKS